MLFSISNNYNNDDEALVKSIIFVNKLTAMPLKITFCLLGKIVI